MEFQTELLELSNNKIISEYFNTRSITQFLLNYIQVDKIISGQTQESLSTLDKITSTLEQLRNDIRNSSDLQKLQSQLLTDRINSIANTDIRTALTEFYSGVDLGNKNLMDLFNEKIQNLFIGNLSEIDQKIITNISTLNSNIVNTLSANSDRVLDTLSNNSDKVISTLSTNSDRVLDTIQNHSQINQISEKLNALHNTFTNNSSKKGEYAENILVTNLIKSFPDSEVLNMSAVPHSGDIQIKKDSKPDILIDSKNFQTNVPKVDLEKFFDDCKLNNTCGILCSAFSGICNKKHMEIDIIEGRVYVYISNHNFDSELFKLAVRVIYGINSIIKERKTDDITLQTLLFERLKVEFMYFNQTLQTHLDAIKSSVASISQLGMTQLDQFFKRSNFNSDLKPFSCPHCSTGCSSTKALNKHIQVKHGIKLTKDRKVKVPEPEPEETSETVEIEEPIEIPIVESLPVMGVEAMYRQRGYTPDAARARGQGKQPPDEVPVGRVLFN
jgi:hypothetical protein